MRASILKPTFAALLTLTLTAVSLAAPTDEWKRASKGAAFAADSSIDAAGIYSAAKAATSKAVTVKGKFRPEQGLPESVQIYQDWLDLQGVSAYHFLADMSVDCDGVAYECAGNTSGTGETSYGHLDATKVPYYVLPQLFVDQHNIKGNSVGAIICDGKMYYAIMGDTNGAATEVIGEASILLAQTCFPDGHISGDNGHGATDVAYIVFGNDVPSGVQDQTIDISALKKLGDAKASALQKALHLGGK